MGNEREEEKNTQYDLKQYPYKLISCIFYANDEKVRK